jgi:hypothetical protein
MHAAPVSERIDACSNACMSASVTPAYAAVLGHTQVLEYGDARANGMLARPIWAALSNPLERHFKHRE